VVAVILLLQGKVKVVGGANPPILVGGANLLVVVVVEVSLEVVAPRSSSSCATPCSHLMMRGDSQYAFNIGLM
jgi:hypothetical protein